MKRAAFALLSACLAASAHAETPATLMMLEGLRADAWQRVLEIRTETDPARLARQLDDADGVVRIFAARRLAVLGPETSAAGARLVGALAADEENLVRAACATAIGRFVTDTTTAIAALERASREDESLMVRQAAGGALANFGPAAQRAMLAHLDRERACDARFVYADMLHWPVSAAALPGPEVTALALEMLEHPRHDCELWLGARLIGNILPADDRVVALLLRVIADAATEIGDEAIRALRRYGVAPGGGAPEPRDPGDPLLERGWRPPGEDKENERYREWARFARERPDEDWFAAVIQPTIDSLAGRLRSPVPSTRLGALVAARELGAVCAPLAADIAALAASPDSTVRRAAWDALIDIDANAARELARRLVRAPGDPGVVRDAIPRAGLLLDARDVVGLLRPLAASGDAATRRAAVNAIALLHAEAAGAVDILAGGLEDAETSRACTAALGSMGPAAREAVPALLRHLDRTLAGTTAAAPYHDCIPIATSIAAIDSAAGREAARRLSATDDDLARQIAARILDPAAVARAHARQPIPARELDTLVAKLSGADRHERERARATLVEAGTAASAAAGRIEKLARTARGEQRGVCYDVLQAIDPRSTLPPP